MGTKFNKTFSDYQLHQVVERQVNQHFENHLCFLKMLVCLPLIHLMQLLAQESFIEFAMKALDCMS